MDLKTNLAIYIYHYAILISGAYIIIGLGFDSRAGVFLVGAVLALFWAGYFRWAMMSKLIKQVTDDEENEEPEHPVEA